MTVLTVSGDGIFYTLQGEGISLGCPVFFLRLHYCNLDCTWCDTRYTWDRALPEFHRFKREGRWTIQETVERLISADTGGCRRLVITGGEPLLQQVALAELLQHLPEWKVEFETNGTIIPREELRSYQFNCSPKLASSGVASKRAINPEALAVLRELNTSFKFVVGSPVDVEEVRQCFVEPYNLPREKVLLSPECRTTEQMIPLMKELAESAKVYGYRLSPRLHILLWDDQRKT